MRKSALTPSTEIRKQLFQVGSLVDAFQRKQSGVVDEWLKWLKVSEDLLKNYGYSETAELAGLRAEIMAVAHGSIRGKEQRKAIRKKALETISVAQRLLLDKQLQLEEKIEKVRMLIRQITTIARQAGMLEFQPGMDFTAFLDQFLLQMQQHEQLQPSISSAIAMIGRSDTLRILAEEVELS